MTNPDDLPTNLPEHLNNPFISPLPPLMPEQDVIASLLEEPGFDERERSYPDHLRRACIMRLNRHYFKPLGRHLSLESRVAHLIREGYDGRNIVDGSYLKHLHDNHERVFYRNLHACANPAISTASAITLIGCSGMGKTETVKRILSLYPQVIEHVKPYSFQQVVWLKLECPHMGSARQLCLDFFQSIDTLLGTRYSRQFQRANLDLLSTQMARVATQHGLGLLVIDELQNLLSDKNRDRGGKNYDRDKLLNFLLTLINKIGVPMLLVGTLAATPLLVDTLRIARRASGLGSVIWDRLERNDGWDFFIKDLWRFQWTREPTELKDDIVDALYEETQGILDLAAKPDIYRTEQLTSGLFRYVAKENFKLLEPMLTALKRGDDEAIMLYDDIRPFHKHIKKIFFNAVPSSGGKEVPDVRAKSAQAPVAPTEARQQVRLALSGLGIAEDVIELLLTEACAQITTDDPVALTTAALAQMRTHQSAPPPTPPVVPVAPSRSARKPKPELRDNDVRLIVMKGKKEGNSAHAALTAAGLISPVEKLYRV